MRARGVSGASRGRYLYVVEGDVEDATADAFADLDHADRVAAERVVPGHDGVSVQPELGEAAACAANDQVELEQVPAWLDAGRARDRAIAEAVVGGIIRS